MERRERHALLLLLGVGLIGHGIRWLESGPRGPADGVTLLSEVPAGDLARQRARSARLARPVRPGERLDLATASAEDIARLPRVGLGLARAIVARRDAGGGFATLADLDAVPGVGPAVLAAIDSLVTVSDTVRRRPVGAGRGRAISRSGPKAPADTQPTVRTRSLPTVVRPPARILPAGPSERPPVNLNSATEADLVALPGIGPTRARAILAYRQSNGPFASVEELQKVPGLGGRLVRQLMPQVTVR